MCTYDAVGPNSIVKPLQTNPIPPFVFRVDCRCSVVKHWCHSWLADESYQLKRRLLKQAALMTGVYIEMFLIVNSQFPSDIWRQWSALYPSCWRPLWSDSSHRWVHLVSFCSRSSLTVDADLCCNGFRTHRRSIRLLRSIRTAMPRLCTKPLMVGAPMKTPSSAYSATGLAPNEHKSPIVTSINTAR